MKEVDPRTKIKKMIGFKEIEPRYECSKIYCNELDKYGVAYVVFPGRQEGRVFGFEDIQFVSSDNNEPAYGFEIVAGGDCDVVVVEEHGFFLPDGTHNQDYYYAGSDESGGRFGVETVCF